MQTSGALPEPPSFPGKGQPGPAAGLQPAGRAAPGLVAELQIEARRLGFSRLGVAPAVTPPHHDALGRWLAAGLAGVMTDWMTRHELLRRDPAAVLPGARSIVMLATDHARGRAATAEEPEPGRGRVARYARGDDYHDLLRSRLNSLASWLEARLPGSQARGVVDSAPLAERDYGRLAGLGWFGKNTMLIDPRAGSYFLLSALLTTVDLPTDLPIAVDHCGTCTACLDACPTGALPEPRLLDATKCISALTIEDHAAVPPELRVGMGDWIFGCDICQEVCPWNRHAPGSAEPAFQPRDAAESLDLAAVLGLDEAGFRARFRGSPILRAKRRGLLRSAAIALGNRPDPAALPALAQAADDGEPAVRGAAAWALGRWLAAGVAADAVRQLLLARAARETDATVLQEIEAACRGQVSSMSPDGSRPGPSAA
ncbi:MAG: Epoxyqueuosine reductase [Planctomycetota bacterium]